MGEMRKLRYSSKVQRDWTVWDFIADFGHPGEPILDHWKGIEKIYQELLLLQDYCKMAK